VGLDQGHHLLNITWLADLFFYVGKRQEFATYQFAQFLGELGLVLWKDPLNGDPQNPQGFAGVKEHFDGDPIGDPANEARDQDQKNLPVLHN
jgi:hypothetical protein